MFYLPKDLIRQLKECSQATLKCLAGSMWPAGRTLPRPALEDGSRILRRQFKLLFTKQRDNGREVKNYPKYRDVIYRRT